MNYGNIFTQSKYKEDVFMFFVQIYIQLHALCIGSFLGNAILQWYNQRSILIWKIDDFLLILHIASISYNHCVLTDTISHSYVKYIMTFITMYYKYKLILCSSRSPFIGKSRNSLPFQQTYRWLHFFWDTDKQDSSFIHIATRRMILYFCQFRRRER